MATVPKTEKPKAPATPEAAKAPATPDATEAPKAPTTPDGSELKFPLKVRNKNGQELLVNKRVYEKYQHTLEIVK